jgi:hypothetical protein
MAASTGQNERLCTQVEKQLLGRELLPRGLRTPEIYDHGTVSGLVYFDMEWVTGRGAQEHLSIASIPEVRSFADRIETYLAWAGGEAPLRDSLHQTVVAALDARLQKIIAEAQARNTGYRILVLLEHLRNEIAQPDLEGLLTPSFCHGDLTLENMLVDQNGDIWLIDWLDAPYEQVLFDGAKLEQDLWGGWYTRTHRSIASYVLAHLRRAVSRGVQIEAVDGMVHRRLREIILAITFARIIPYTVAPADLEFVVQRLERCVHRLCNFR